MCVNWFSKFLDRLPYLHWHSGTASLCYISLLMTITAASMWGNSWLKPHETSNAFTPHWAASVFRPEITLSVQTHVPVVGWAVDVSQCSICHVSNSCCVIHVIPEKIHLWNAKLMQIRSTACMSGVCSFYKWHLWEITLWISSLNWWEEMSRLNKTSIATSIILVYTSVTHFMRT